MSCLFSQYKDIFGAPGTGVHAYKFLGTSIVDFGLSMLLAVFVTWKFKMPLELSVILMLALGILFHILFGVQTSTLEYLGITC